jgi:hypothetical protein
LLNATGALVTGLIVLRIRDHPVGAGAAR